MTNSPNPLLQPESAGTPNGAAVEAFVRQVLAQVEQVWIGPSRYPEAVLLALLSGGHVLIEDVPGVGKTLLARSLSKALGCSFTRLQLTPDVMPADVTGFMIYEQATASFKLRHGPVFTNVLLADEINRALPRTQASLLEAMAEGSVTIDGETYKLPHPFFVLATQNPIDTEGTFPLPEAQRDRFLLRLPLGYPELEAELQILDRYSNSAPLSAAIDQVKAVADPNEIARLQNVCRQVYVSPPVREYILALTRATREHSAVALGASPRASLGLLWVAQARAAAQGRTFVLPDDVKIMAEFCLAHRLLLHPQAELSGTDPAEVVREIIRHTPVPVEETNTTAVGGIGG